MQKHKINGVYILAFVFCLSTILITVHEVRQVSRWSSKSSETIADRLYANKDHTRNGGLVATRSRDNGETDLGGVNGGFMFFSPNFFTSCFLFDLIISNTASSEFLNFRLSNESSGLLLRIDFRLFLKASVTAVYALVRGSRYRSVLLPGHSTLCSSAVLIRCRESSMVLNLPTMCAGLLPREDEPWELPRLWTDALTGVAGGFSCLRIRWEVGSFTLLKWAGEVSIEDPRLFTSSLDTFNEVPGDSPADTSDKKEVVVSMNGALVLTAALNPTMKSFGSGNSSTSASDFRYVFMSIGGKHQYFPCGISDFFNAERRCGLLLKSLCNFAGTPLMQIFPWSGRKENTSQITICARSFWKASSQINFALVFRTCTSAASSPANNLIRPFSPSPCNTSSCLLSPLCTEPRCLIT